MSHLLSFNDMLEKLSLNMTLYFGEAVIVLNVSLRIVN